MMRNLPSTVLKTLFAASLALLIDTSQSIPQAKSGYFAIKVVDQETGRGVPLVELTTTSQQRFYTDSNGLIALDESSLMNHRVSFAVSSHGYQRAESVLLSPTPGGEAIVKIQRLNVAERLYRITGQDIYGASALLGLPIPIKHQGLNGGVTGQDTFIETLYKGKLYWFWGDTKGLAQFNGKASGATSELPGRGGLDPGAGIDLDYFTNADGFSKPMCPFGGPTLVWIQWLTTALDASGNERLYALYKCINKDGNPGEAGFAIFNDTSQSFEVFKTIKEWYGLGHRSGHPCRVNVNGREYLYIINYSGCERVQAEVAHFTDPSQYEHFTCIAAASGADSAAHLERDASGNLIYGWKSHTDRFNHRRQEELVHDGAMKQAEGLWQFKDYESGDAVPTDAASVFWNSYRKCWVMLAYEFTGGVWYFEGDTPTGPWVYGRKIVSHEHYDFYNVGQHAEFDQDGGRLIYFEGTYTTGFSGNKVATPLYDYNQMMYRLALDDERLTLPSPIYYTRNNQFLMREAVDSLNLWGSIDAIPFFAIPPGRRHGDFIPVYTDRERLTTMKPRRTAHQSPLFYALPLDTGTDSLMDPVSGTWKCTAKMPDGSESEFDLELQKRGINVTGPNVTRGVFSNGNLELELQILDYSVRGRLKDGALVGEYQKADGTESGIWSGIRSLVESRKESSAVVFLYEYTTPDGKYFYSVDSALTTPSLKRRAAPICRVWRNPSTVLALDYEARAVLMP